MKYRLKDKKLESLYREIYPRFDKTLNETCEGFFERNFNFVVLKLVRSRESRIDDISFWRTEIDEIPEYEPYRSKSAAGRD